MNTKAAKQIIERAGTARISQAFLPTVRACSWVPGHGFHTKVHSYLSRALPSRCLSCAPHRPCLPHSSKYSIMFFKVYTTAFSSYGFSCFISFLNKSHGKPKPNIQQYPLPLCSLIPLANNPQDLHSRVFKTMAHTSSST